MTQIIPPMTDLTMTKSRLLKTKRLVTSNIMSIFEPLYDLVTYSLMKKSQSLVDEREETKHSKYNNKNNEGKGGGRSKFGAAQYKQFKNRTTVEESTSNYYKHKRNNSGAGDNLIP